MSINFWLRLRIAPYSDNWENIVNFSNTNAHNILRLLNMKGTLAEGGIVKYEDLSKLRQKILVALNQENMRSAAVIESFVDEQEGMATWIECGSTDESVVRRLRLLDELAWVAQTGKEKSDLVWG